MLNFISFRVIYFKSASNTAYSPPIVPVAVMGWVDISTIKVQVVSTIITANRTRPVEAEDTGITQGITIDATRPYKVVWIRT